MIPTTYKTEAEAIAIRNSNGEGSLLLTLTYTNANNTNPSLGGVLSAAAIQRIQTTNLSSPTAVISTALTGGVTQADVDYITGMRTRITDSITAYYASKPNLSPFAANNKQTSQTDANVRDNFLQAIFKYDPRYGVRMRLSDQTESILYRDTGSYQLPNRNSFIYNPYVEATMRIHGAGNITDIDDDGVGGAYRITTATPHGLYDGQLMSADLTITPIPGVDTHGERTITKLTQEVANSVTVPTNSYYTTAAAHNFVQGQRFVPTDNDLGLSGGFDSNDVFLGYQRDRFIKPLTSTTFELHRNYACTDRITVGYYNGSANHSQTGAGPYLVSGVTMQVIDGAPILFDPISGTNTNVAVFQRDTIASVDITTGVWTATATIAEGLQDGMLTNFNNFTGTDWSAMNSYDYPLYFKRINNTTFTLHTSPTTLDSTTLWRPGNSGVKDDLDAIQYTSSIWTLTFTRPHNVLHGQDIRLYSVGVEFGGQNFDTYTYSGAGTAYWTLGTTSDHIDDGTRIIIGSGTSGASGPGFAFDIASTEVTMPTDLFVKRRGSAGSKEIELYTNSALTTRWEPYAVNGTHTVEANTFIAQVYYAKVVDELTIQLYQDSALSTPWNPTLGSGSVTAITSGATGNTATPRYVATRTSPGAGYIQPMFFPKTEGYTYISLYKDTGLTQQFQITGGGVVTSGTMSGGPGFGLSGVEPGSPELQVDNYEATPTCYRMNNISHRFLITDAGNGSSISELTFGGTPNILPAFYVKKISNTEIDLYIDSNLQTALTAPAISTVGTSGGIIASIYQQQGNFRFDKVYARNMGLLTYYYNNYTAGTTPVLAIPTTTFYTSHFETNGVFNYSGNNANWPAITVEEYTLDSAGVYKGHLRPCKTGSDDSVTGRKGIDGNTYGVTTGSPVYYTLAQPGRFLTGSPMVLGIKAANDVGTFVEDPLGYNGAQWDQDSLGQEYRAWPQTVQPASMTWTIEQPTQVIETVNMNRYTRTRDLSQYRLKLTYPPMTSGQIQEYIAVIHAARGAAKPFRFYMPRSNLIPVTLAMQNKSVQMPANFFVRSNLTAGTRILEVDGMPPNMTENNPAMFNGCGCNMRVFNAMGSMMMPISNVRTNAYGEANVRINNGIPQNITVGHWFDSFIIYLDVFIDGNTVDIKVDTRGFHYLEIDMVTKRVF